MKINLLVVRCKDLEISKEFYQQMGLSFIKEKHGEGPSHYSCEMDGFVFELYPNRGEAPTDRNRLGFKVPCIERAIRDLDIVDRYEFDGTSVYVVNDPDGRKVELSE